MQGLHPGQGFGRRGEPAGAPVPPRPPHLSTRHGGRNTLGLLLPVYPTAFGGFLGDRGVRRGDETASRTRISEGVEDGFTMKRGPRR